MATISEVARILNVDRDTLMLWVTKFAEHLSLTARPPKGRERQFTERDLRVLALVSDLWQETIEKSGIEDGIDLDLVTHDAKKFFGLMLKKNGYVLEQVLSPLVVHTTSEHAELKETAANCITRHHAHHYLGFASTQWKLFQKEDPPRVKPLLYVYRVC